MATFLVPSLKLKVRKRGGATVEDRIHRYLLRRFGGYTAAAGNIFGNWRGGAGREFYGEHKEYKVALIEDRRIAELKRFVATLARDLGEQCIFMEAGKDAWFIYPSRR